MSVWGIAPGDHALAGIRVLADRSAAGLGTGSDVKSAWLLTLTAICVIAVAIAVCANAPRLA